jgi:hypothetical protein
MSMKSGTQLTDAIQVTYKRLAQKPVRLNRYWHKRAIPGVLPGGTSVLCLDTIQHVQPHHSPLMESSSCLL